MYSVAFYDPTDKKIKTVKISVIVRTQVPTITLTILLKKAFNKTNIYIIL